jgi:hypothetical protein
MRPQRGHAAGAQFGSLFPQALLLNDLTESRSVERKRDHKDGRCAETG